MLKSSTFPRSRSLTGKCPAKPSGQALVQQDAHALGSGCGGPQQRVLGQLQRGNRLKPRDGWEVLKELIERMPAFEIVNEGLYGHARADKDRRAAENLGIGMNYAGLSRHRDLTLTRLNLYRNTIARQRSSCGDHMPVPQQMVLVLPLHWAAVARRASPRTVLLYRRRSYLRLWFKLGDIRRILKRC